MARIVYSSHHNIGFFGLERLHPFDAKKYGRAWTEIQKSLGVAATRLLLKTDREASADELKLVHSDDYLTRLKESSFVAQALEVAAVRKAPAWLIDRQILRPMRWATRGTIMAAQAASSEGFAVNLGGGFHHAKPNGGEGFSIYSDIGIAIESLRANGMLQPDSRVVYVDTDAHQGNGVCHVFMDDSRVFIFDVFNPLKYPMFDVEARARVDCEVPVDGSTSDERYLAAISKNLPAFLDSVCRGNVGLAIYNAGTDVVQHDPLGGLDLSIEAVFRRDLMIVEMLRERSIPTAMVLSGGYTRDSYQTVAKSVVNLVVLEQKIQFG